MFLLGVEWGHIYEKTPVLNKFGVQQNHQYVLGASGMNGVVPAWRLKELLEMPALKGPFQRAEKAALLKSTESRSVIQPTLAEDSGAKFVSPASDENPNHLEDFKRLVDVAVKKKLKD
jgi:hypothetical protein